MKIEEAKYILDFIEFVNTNTSVSHEFHEHYANCYMNSTNILNDYLK